MKFFKTLISLHTVKLIVIFAIAIIYLATMATNSSNKNNAVPGSGSIADEESKSLSAAEVEPISPRSETNF